MSAHTGSPADPANLFAGIDPRILDKWVRISHRLEKALNEPAPLDAMDGVGMLIASAAAALHTGMNDLAPEARSLAATRFGETETIVAKFFDDEMMRTYAAAGDTPIAVAGLPDEVEGNPTYKSFGFVVGCSAVISEVCVMILSTNETAPIATRISNHARLVQPPAFYTRNADRMIDFMGHLNFPKPVGVVDRVGVSTMIVSDTIAAFLPQLDPVNQKTTVSMVENTQMFVAKLIANVVRMEGVDRAPTVLGTLGGVCKVCVDVITQTMDVIERQQAAGGVLAQV